jgi:maltose alpha-D-glucosyltransferase / alpha-amylase
MYFPPIMDPVYGFQSVNVEAQQRQSFSLLHWMRQMIRLRRQHPVFGRGTMTFRSAENRTVLAFTRQWQGDTILCIYNLSRASQPLQLDLSEYEGIQPIDLQYKIKFPRIAKEPYQLALNEYGFYWLQL